MSENKISWSNKTVKLGGTLTVDQIGHVEEIFKNAALEAVTSGKTAESIEIAEIAEILGVDSATIEDAETDHLEEVGA